jgi:cell division protease FtsH
MSDKLGRLRYVDNQEEVFLGHSVSRSQTISGATAKLIDEEIRRLIEEAEKKARAVLTEHMDDLHAVTKALLEFETLSGDEVRTIVEGGTIDRSDESRPGPTGRRSSVPSSGKAKDAGKDKGKDAGETPGSLEPEPQPGG